MYIMTCYMLKKLFQQNLTYFVRYVKKEKNSAKIIHFLRYYFVFLQVQNKYRVYVQFYVHTQNIPLYMRIFFP
jgi:hypothetical protein